MLVLCLAVLSPVVIGTLTWHFTDKHGNRLNMVKYS